MGKTIEIEEAKKTVYEIRASAFNILDIAKHIVLITGLYDSKLHSTSSGIDKEELVELLELLINFISQIEKQAYDMLNKARNAKYGIKPVDVD